MPDKSDTRRPRSQRVSNASASFMPRIVVTDIFRRLIVDELRSGRLTPARRRRIVRYACQMGLSAVEAGQLMAACREEALASRHPVERRTALRLVEPPLDPVPVGTKIVLAVGVIALGVLVLDLFW